jgi:hypothetical protein
LLKEAYEKAKAVNATLLYFQDAKQNETKMENIKWFKSYIVDALFSGQELKKYIMAFSFAVPRLKDGVRDMIVVKTSGKAGAQIPHLPLGDDSSPLGEIMQYVCNLTRSTRLSVTGHSQPLINAKYQFQVANYL